jgi:hypothetical protein
MMVTPVRRLLLAAVALATLGDCSSVSGREVSEASGTSADRERFVRVIEEHRPKLLAWVEAERACDAACDADPMQLVSRYESLLGMARTLSLDLTIAEPAPRDAADLVARTETEVRHLREHLRGFTDCMHSRESIEDCRDMQREAEQSWRAVPGIFRAWEQLG